MLVVVVVQCICLRNISLPPPTSLAPPPHSPPPPSSPPLSPPSPLLLLRLLICDSNKVQNKHKTDTGERQHK